MSKLNQGGGTVHMHRKKAIPDAAPFNKRAHQREHDPSTSTILGQGAKVHMETGHSIVHTTGGNPLYVSLVTWDYHEGITTYDYDTSDHRSGATSNIVGLNILTGEEGLYLCTLHLFFDPTAGTRPTQLAVAIVSNNSNGDYLDAVLPSLGTAVSDPQRFTLSGVYPSAQGQGCTLTPWVAAYWGGGGTSTIDYVSSTFSIVRVSGLVAQTV